MFKKSRPVNLLLVEDNPGDIRLTKEAFREANTPININVVMDGEEAISYLRQLKPYESAVMPDLVLLDLNLPKRNGREVLAEIKKDPILKTIPVVILTTSNAELDIVKSYELNANSYITKPVDFDMFFEIIQKIEQFWLSTAILPSMIR